MFFAGKGTAMVLSLKDIPPSTKRRLSTDSNRSTNSSSGNNSEIQQHLQSMFYLLRHEETLKMAVKLESHHPGRTRYLAIVSRTTYMSNDSKGRKSTSPYMEKRDSSKSSDGATEETGREIEESCLLGIDCNEKTTIGLVLRILADTTIRLDGDGGFSISVYGKTHIFKPVSVQAMWSALQTLHKVSQKARENNFYPGGPSHGWVSYYENSISSDRSYLNEWNAMDSIESRRPPSPDAIRNKPTKREETEQVIKMTLKEIMMSVDLDEVTSKFIRGRLEDHLDMDLDEYKSFIDEEMLIILGQMDAPTEIFEHVYLGSEWNASNLEELQKNGVRHILNVTREIDNFFPGMFDYCNIRVYDDEKTNLLKHWDNTFKYISRAKAEGSKVLVHCKMGISRSASVVIAYAMKAYNWNLKDALEHVKKRRNCIKPNKNFLTQLETYRGMLDAMKNKEKLQRSKSETNLKSVKDARLLPGSEPTPLIQALNKTKSTNPASPSSTSSPKRPLRRSNSASPKNVQSDIINTKPQSHSLENLVANKVAEEAKNVRLPCSNGQNYSVTQNQVLHIQKNSSLSSVKTIVSELESSSSEKNISTINFMASKSEWKGGTPVTNVVIGSTYSDEEFSDPQDRATVQYRRSDMVANSKRSSVSSTDNPIWTSSAQIIHQTITSAESYERSSIPSSRQSSCSSVDSAVFLGYGGGERREMISRHSSWGSGDNRVLPSRNSSWGSCDTNHRLSERAFNLNAADTAIFEGQIMHSGQHDSNLFSGSKYIPYYPGTVKRTKQKLEESTPTFSKKVCEGSLKAASANEDLTPRRGTNTTSYSHPPRGQNFRCNSEEIIQNYNLPTAHSYGMLSVSAPEAFSMPSKIIEDSIAKSKGLLQQEGGGDGMTPPIDKIAGTVQHLKMNFEAKANSSSSPITGHSSSKKGSSLPSSPVAPHDEARTRLFDKTKNEPTKDLSVKGLVSKYQSPDSRPASFNCHRTRPKSFYDSRSNVFHQNETGSGGCISKYPIISQKEGGHVTIRISNDLSKPPPIPPTFKASTAATNIVVPMTTDKIISSSSSSSTTSAPASVHLHHSFKKSTNQQQFGKTHPLATLSLSKPRFNTAATYNTM